ncbi:MAG: hypothetical protein ACO3CV_07850 [Steroidobacteraceae bacterium]
MAERKSFLLRIDPALWQALERCAADELRSVNAEVEFLLREALKRRGRWSDAESGDAVSVKKAS